MARLDTGRAPRWLPRSPSEPPGRRPGHARRSPCRRRCAASPGARRAPRPGSSGRSRPGACARPRCPRARAHRAVAPRGGSPSTSAALAGCGRRTSRRLPPGGCARGPSPASPTGPGRSRRVCPSSTRTGRSRGTPCPGRPDRASAWSLRRRGSATPRWRRGRASRRVRSDARPDSGERSPRRRTRSRRVPC